MIGNNNQIEEKKLPLGVKIISWLWIFVAVLISPLGMFIYCNLISDSECSVMMLAPLTTIISIILLIFSIGTMRNKKFGVIGLSIVSWVTFVSLLIFFVDVARNNNASFFELVSFAVLLTGVILVQLVTALYLTFSKKVKEAFKK